MRHASSGLPTPVARPPRLVNALLAAVLLAASAAHAATWGPFNAEFPAAADGLVKKAPAGVTLTLAPACRK